jgi:hypothetical protein
VRAPSTRRPRILRRVHYLAAYSIPRPISRPRRTPARAYYPAGACRSSREYCAGTRAVQRAILCAGARAAARRAACNPAAHITARRILCPGAYSTRAHAIRPRGAPPAYCAACTLPRHIAPRHILSRARTPPPHYILSRPARQTQIYPFPRRAPRYGAPDILCSVFRATAARASTPAQYPRAPAGAPEHAAPRVPQPARPRVYAVPAYILPRIPYPGRAQTAVATPAPRRGAPRVHS